MQFYFYKKYLQDLRNFVPLFFIANYFLISLVNNLYLGGNPKESLVPILLLIVVFGLSLLSSKHLPKNISQSQLLLIVDVLLFLNIVIFVTGKFNAEGQFFKTFQGTFGINFKILLITAAVLFFSIKILFKKFNSLFASFAFTAVFFFSTLLIIPLLYPNPFIDVFVILKQGIMDFSQNSDPYKRIYQDIYNGIYDLTYQKQEIKLVYWPLNLYILYPFQIIFGDLRFAYIFAMLISCLVLYIATTEKKIFYLSFILLFTNAFTFYMVKYAWIDVLAFPFFALYFLMFQRKKFIFAFLILGILMALKLYYIFILPVSILYLYNTSKSIRQVILPGILSVLMMALCFMPYLISNPAALWYSITYFTNSLPRIDSLSITGYIYQFHYNFSSIGTMISLFIFVAILFRIWKEKRTALAFQIQDLTIILFALFIFGKQAFGNYYFNLMFLSIIYLSFIKIKEKKTISN